MGPSPPDGFLAGGEGLCPAAGVARDADDNFYVCFDSAEFGGGMIQAVITAYVPDAAFPDGFRTEVYAMDLVNVKRV